MSNLDTKRLRLLIAAKLQVVELLVGLARRQLHLAEQGDASALLKLLAAKQSVLEQLSRLERELDPYRSQDPDRRVWDSPADRQQCQLDAERCGQLLGELLALEQQGEAAVVLRRDAASTALASAHTAADARGAYANEGQTPAVPALFRCEG